MEVLAVDVEALRGARVAERHQRVERPHRRARRLLPQLKPETILRRQPHLWPTTIRNCWFTLFRIEDAPNETGNAT